MGKKELLLSKFANQKNELCGNAFIEFQNIFIEKTIETIKNNDFTDKELDWFLQDNKLLSNILQLYIDWEKKYGLSDTAQLSVVAYLDNCIKKERKKKRQSNEEM